MATTHEPEQAIVRPIRWRVGILAQRTGLSVRTLHYYDEIGLLAPSLHTASGHRRYGEQDIVRLQQIVSLRQLGFSLEQIRTCLEQPGHAPLDVVRQHLDRVKQDLVRQRRLCDRLEALAHSLRRAKVVSVEEFVRTIEAISMFEKYFTPEQLDAIKQRGAQLGEQRIEQVEASWPQLIAEVRTEMDRGTDPASKRARALAQRWMALVHEFTGGDRAIAQSLRAMYAQEPNLGQRFGAPMEQSMLAYIGKAIEAAARDGGRP
ncbi:MAG: MerR family transcriptional regulator [Planctomycetota bacterium]